MTLCTFMPSSLTQVHTLSVYLHCAGNLLASILPPRMFLFFHACRVTLYRSSILHFFHSITFTGFLFFLFPPSSLPVILLLLSPSTLILHILLLLSFLLPSTTPPSSLLPASFHPHCGCISGVGVADACLPGFRGAAGVCNDHGKTYALYAITVFRRNQDGSEDCWKTYRRYSDFHDFHMRITEQVPGPLSARTRQSSCCVCLSFMNVLSLFSFSLRTWRRSSSCQGRKPSTTWTETSWRREKKTSTLTYRCDIHHQPV